MAPVALGAAWAGGWWFAALILAVGFYATVEWNRMTGSAHAAFTIVNAASLTLAVLALQDVGGWLALAFVLAGASLVAAVALVRKQPLFWPVSGLIYLGIAIIALVWLRDYGGFLLVLWVLLIIWASDTGAYLVGSRVGGPKLAPRLSPNKTWSGLIGGCITAGLVSAGFAHIAGGPAAAFGYPFVQFLVGFVLAGWSQVGDIVESTIKRRFNVKDSGNIIPGHGGVLDRIDSLVFTAPLVALSIILLRETGVLLHG
jgi:phosphatidate cytidylyltransferase